jgi:hypothetical protein
MLGDGVRGSCGGAKDGSDGADVDYHAFARGLRGQGFADWGDGGRGVGECGGGVFEHFLDAGARGEKGTVEVNVEYFLPLSSRAGSKRFC